MDSDYVLIDREALQQQLRRAFDDQTVDVFLSVLDRVAGQVRAAAPIRDDFTRLREAVEQLQ